MPDQSPYHEQELLQQVANGSEPAFRQLYDAHHQRIYALAFFLVHTDALAEEVTQEIFIKVWTNRTELSAIRNFNAWLKTLVRNHVYTYMSRMAKEQLILQEISQRSTHSSNTTELDVQDNEYSHLLQQAVKTLSPQQQKVYLLSREQGMKQEEIAEILGLSSNTVKNHMKAALHHIRIFLDGRTDALVSVAIALFLCD